MGENQAGSFGLPLPIIDTHIVRLETKKTELPPGGPGDLIIHGPPLMQGYQNIPQETALALLVGRLYTSDIAIMGEDGFFIS